MTLYRQSLASPIGEIVIVGDDHRLASLDFGDCCDRMDALLAARFGGSEVKEKLGFGGFASRLEAYFAGELDALDPIETRWGGTAFQQSVWRALREIPPGRTATYGEVAERLGNPGASRAVGLANSKNPIALVAPCHRVIGAGGKLTGYAGGLERKQWLLRHEGALL